MGSKQKPAKAKGSDTSSEVVVFKASRWTGTRLGNLWQRFIRSDRRLVFGVGGLVFILLVALVLLLAHNSPTAPKGPPPAVDNDFAETYIGNLPVLLDYYYGLTENDILHGNLHHELKTFDEAHNIAIALNRLGSHQRALEAYKIAVNKAPGNTDQSFYEEVMTIAYQFKDNSYGDLMYRKAEAKIQSSDLTAGGKQALMNSLNFEANVAKTGGS